MTKMTLKFTYDLRAAPIISSVLAIALDELRSKHSLRIDNVLFINDNRAVPNNWRFPRYLFKSGYPNRYPGRANERVMLIYNKDPNARWGTLFTHNEV